MSVSRCRLARFLDPPVSTNASFTSTEPWSVSTDRDAIATLEGCLSPVVARKKALLKHISLFRLFVLILPHPYVQTVIQTGLPVLIRIRIAGIQCFRQIDRIRSGRLRQIDLNAANSEIQIHCLQIRPHRHYAPQHREKS